MRGLKTPPVAGAGAARPDAPSGAKLGLLPGPSSSGCSAQKALVSLCELTETSGFTLPPGVTGKNLLLQESTWRRMGGSA